jgi:hypothetical protein
MLLRLTRINLGWRRKKAKPIADFDHFIVADLFVGPSGYYLEEIAIRPDGRLGHMSQLQASHLPGGHCVVLPVDLDLEVVGSVREWASSLFVVVHRENLQFLGVLVS